MMFCTLHLRYEPKEADRIFLSQVPEKNPATLATQTVQFKGGCLLTQRYFCAVYDYARKADFSKGFWYPERKLEVTTNFSEIIKQQ